MIRDLRPKFNLTAAFSRIYPSIAIKYDEVSGWSWLVFTHRPDELPSDFKTHGAWRSRPLALEAFEALESLLGLLGTPGRRAEVFGQRSGLQGRLARSSKAFAVRGLRTDFLEELDLFFRGSDKRMLENLAFSLLDLASARRKSS